MNYKKLILKYTPTLAHRLIRDFYFWTKLVPNFAYDFRRYLNYSGLNKSNGYRSERAARITLFYHQVEKGLSLSSPRAGFGMNVIPRLLDDVDTYFSNFGISEPATTAVAALENYVNYHLKIGNEARFVRQKLDDIYKNHKLDKDTVNSWKGGVREITKEELLSSRERGFQSFFESRHSIRNFAPGEIPISDLEKAVQIAQKTPSVCNRQTWKVHAFNNPEKMAALLQIQNGSRGFGEQAGMILVVTSELGNFVDVGERYQSWIDGGMFAMSLCLAFHDLGYGSCCLNWSKDKNVDKNFRHAANIPNSEQIIMLIAVGNLPQKFHVAYSYRPPVDRCLVVH